MKKKARDYRNMVQQYEGYIAQAFKYVNHPIFAYRTEKYLTFAENKINHFAILYLDKNNARYKGLVSRLLRKLENVRTKITRLQEAIK